MKQYKLVLDSQLGPREGTMQLEDQNGSLKGTITLLGYENPVSGEWIGEHTIRLFHHLRTHVRELSCVSIFEMNGNAITGTLKNGWNVMKWHGEKVDGKRGGDTENGKE